MLDQTNFVEGLLEAATKDPGIKDQIVPSEKIKSYILRKRKYEEREEKINLFENL